MHFNVPLLSSSRRRFATSVTPELLPLLPLPLPPPLPPPLFKPDSSVDNGDGDEEEEVAEGVVIGPLPLLFVDEGGLVVVLRSISA